MGNRARPYAVALALSRAADPDGEIRPEGSLLGLMSRLGAVEVWVAEVICRTVVPTWIMEDALTEMGRMRAEDAADAESLREAANAAIRAARSE